MLLLTQSLGVSDIPDLIVAALWGVAAVLAVMTCFISKNKRAVVGLSLLALAAAGLFYYVFNYIVAFAMERAERSLAYYQ